MSLKALKQQFSKMVDACNIEAPESSSAIAAIARKFLQIWTKCFKLSHFVFLKKNRDI